MIGVAMKAYEGLIGMLVTILPVAAANAVGHLPGGKPEPGISRELATWRAEQYRDLRYVLKLELTRPFERLRGELLIVVTIDAPEADLVLDWRPGEGAGASDLRVNGVTPDAVASAQDHLVIPEALLHAGENRIELRFDAPVRASGTAVTRFHDSQDQTDYLYTLLVPADASSVFPCFDQPDLKARFELTVTAPSDWRVIGNAPELEITSNGEMATTRFAATEPISTYLRSRGPSVDLKDQASGTRLFVRRSRLERARQEADEVFRLTRQSAAYFADYFAQPFPFAKYDLVLIPELAYGGMEHAGATFLREDSMLFPFQPAAADRLRRAQLIFHETAHQWFGDLVTMRWFDDMAGKDLPIHGGQGDAALLPEFDAWNAFRAPSGRLRTDATRGTTPIWQALPNLAAAKSAYGNIVYSKAPAVLRQAEFFLGEEVFRSAVREFTARHAFGAADWSDLVGAFEHTSGRSLQVWADAWVKRRGLPAVRVAWGVDAEGRLADVVLSQRDALGEGGVWPMRVQVVAVYADGNAVSAGEDPVVRVRDMSRQGEEVALGVAVSMETGAQQHTDAVGASPITIYQPPWYETTP
jgi:aminopeptidase N